ncbi:MAG: hypothetical protein KGI37_07440 [Alphaproteobacteria bacterium]|nr:hypothetical protein [Alphaproteobacteria bacterium]
MASAAMTGEPDVEREVVRAFPMGRRLEAYVTALTRRAAGEIHFRTGAGRILRDLMLHWPVLPGYEDDALELCERISEAVYPLAAALYAQAVDIAVTISAQPLIPPAAIPAMATYLVFDSTSGIMRQCSLSPRQPPPDGRALGAAQGIAVMCKPLNYRYHTIKDDRKRSGHPHAGIFELSQRLINELYELPPLIAPEQKIAATLITKIHDMPKAMQRAETSRAAGLARPLPYMRPAAPVIAVTTSLSALPPPVRALERRIMAHALDKNLSQELRAGLRQAAQTLRAAWPQATVDEAARRQTEPPLNPAASAVARPARAASPAPQAAPVIIPSPLPPRAVPPPVFAPPTAISTPPSVVVAATPPSRDAAAPAARPAASLAPALNAPQTKAAEVSPPRRAETAGLQPQSRPQPAQQVPQRQARAETATPRQEPAAARYNQTNEAGSPAAHPAEQRGTAQRPSETPSARPETARTPEAAPSRQAEARAQRPQSQPQPQRQARAETATPQQQPAQQPSRRQASPETAAHQEARTAKPATKADPELQAHIAESETEQTHPAEQRGATQRPSETPSARPETARTSEAAPSRQAEARVQRSQPRPEPQPQPQRQARAETATPRQEPAAAGYNQTNDVRPPTARQTEQRTALSSPQARPVRPATVRSASARPTPAPAPVPARPAIEPVRFAGVHPLGTPTLVEWEPAHLRRDAVYRVGPSGQPAPARVAPHADALEQRHPRFYQSIKMTPQAALWSRPVIDVTPAVGKLYKNAVFTPAAAPPRGPAVPALKGFTAMSALLRATLPTPEPAPMPHWGPPRGKK